MKNKTLMTIVSLFLAVTLGMAFTARLSTGYGSLFTATTGSTLVTIENPDGVGVYATSISIINSGTSTVFSAVNVTRAAFSNLLTAGTTVPVPASGSYTFNSEILNSVCIATTNGTAEVFVGACAK